MILSLGPSLIDASVSLITSAGQFLSIKPVSVGPIPTHEQHLENPAQRFSYSRRIYTIEFNDKTHIACETGTNLTVKIFLQEKKVALRKYSNQNTLIPSVSSTVTTDSQLYIINPNISSSSSPWCIDIF